MNKKKNNCSAVFYLEAVLVETVYQSIEEEVGFVDSVVERRRVCQTCCLHLLRVTLFLAARMRNYQQAPDVAHAVLTLPAARRAQQQ